MFRSAFPALAFALASTCFFTTDARADCASAFECLCSFQPEAVAEIEILSLESGATVRIVSIEALTATVTYRAGDTVQNVYGGYGDAQAGDRALAVQSHGELQVKGRIEDGKFVCGYDDDFRPSIEDAKNAMSLDYSECAQEGKRLGLEEIPCNDTGVFCGCQTAESSTPPAGDFVVFFMLGTMIVGLEIWSRSRKRRARDSFSKRAIARASDPLD